MDMDLSPDVTESFRLFQSRILAEYDKIVGEYGLLTMDATQDIETQQEQMRTLVEAALRGYKPRRGTYGRRTLFWRRFEISRSE
jgi:dTMP kinase